MVILRSRGLPSCELPLLLRPILLALKQRLGLAVEKLSRQPAGPPPTELIAAEEQKLLVDQLLRLGQRTASASGVPGALQDHRLARERRAGQSIPVSVSRRR